MEVSAEQLSAAAFSSEHVATHLLAFLAGCVTAYLVMLTVLRRLRSIERALQDRERQFRRVIDSSSDVVSLYDLNLVVVYVTPSVKDVLGYSPESVVGASVETFVHPDDMEVVRRSAQQVLAEGRVPPFKVRARHADGGWIWVESAGRLIRGENGASDLLYFAARDITDRVRMQRELAARERKLRAILDRALDPIIGTRSDGSLVEWNHAAEVAFGWDRDEILGRPVSILTPVELRDQQLVNMETALQSDVDDRTRPFESRVVCKDGHEIPVEMTIWSVDEASGRLVMGVVRDISVRKEIEEALIAAREKAVEASQLKSEFLATMSHEIRTPMNGVIGYTDVLLDTPLSEAQREYAMGIAKAGEALLQVINDILDFSKLEAGKVVLDDVVFEIGSVIDEVVDLVAGSARAKGLELIGYATPHLPPAVHGDPGRLRQVLLNLASNAVKFTEQGEIIVRADRAEELETDSDVARNAVWVRLAVSDTGSGISESAQERIFDAFTQADASTTRRFGGTGLGLAISTSLVAAMGGRIGVESQLDVGSTFQVELPLRRALSAPAPAVASEELDLAGVRVLVVDDNAASRQVLDRQLRSWQMIPTTVEDAATALREFDAAAREDRHYDIALLDMAMPAMNGLELAKVMSTDPSIPRVRLVMMSSAGALDDASARAAGLTASLTKPVHQAQLRACLGRAMAAPVGAPSAEVVAEPGSVAPASAAPAQDQQGVGGAATARKRILLAEDNDVNQRVGVAMLARLGYDTDVAANGVEALRRTAEAQAAGVPYDAILMDAQMPEMDGFEATIELRRREGGVHEGGLARGHREEGAARHTPVIALTAAAREEDRQRCLAAGMDDYVSKPFSRAGLAETLSRWVGGPAGGPVEPESRPIEQGPRAVGPGPRPIGQGLRPVGSGPRPVDQGPGLDDARQAEVRRSVRERIEDLQDPDGGDEDLLRGVLDSFLRRVPESMRKIAANAERNDLDSLRDEAHSLKGASSNVGAKELAAACAELEDDARSGHAERTDALMVRIDEAFRRVKPVIVEVRDSLPASGAADV